MHWMDTIRLGEAESHPCHASQTPHQRTRRGDISCDTLKFNYIALHPLTSSNLRPTLLWYYYLRPVKLFFPSCKYSTVPDPAPIPTQLPDQLPDQARPGQYRTKKKCEIPPSSSDKQTPHPPQPAPNHNLAARIRADDTHLSEDPESSS